MVLELLYGCIHGLESTLNRFGYEFDFAICCFFDGYIRHYDVRDEINSLNENKRAVARFL